MGSTEVMLGHGHGSDGYGKELITKRFGLSTAYCYRMMQKSIGNANID